MFLFLLKQKWDASHTGVLDFVYNNYDPLCVTGENRTRRPGFKLGTVTYCGENSS